MLNNSLISRIKIDVTNSRSHDFTRETRPRPSQQGA